MFEIFQESYFNNTLLTWLTSFAIIVLSVILGRVAYWVFAKVIRGVTSRTKSKLDDILVKMVEQPVVFFLAAAGIWFGLTILKLPEAIETAINSSYQVIVALLVGWLMSRLFDAVHQEYLLPWVQKSENDLDDQLLPIIKKGVKITIWAMAVIIGLSNAGYNVGALIAGLGIGGLALAMAAKDTVSNMFGGVTIFTDQPFRINDRIKVAGYDGNVAEIGVRSTKLRTLEGRVVTIPNATFADTPVENISREPSRKIILNLGMTYDTTPDQMQQAMDLVKEINSQSKNTEQKTIVSFNGFGDFAMNIMFIYYIRRGSDVADTQSEINMQILRHFTDAGLEFAFPTQTLYNINGNQP